MVELAVAAAAVSVAAEAAYVHWVNNLVADVAHGRFFPERVAALRVVPEGLVGVGVQELLPLAARTAVYADQVVLGLFAVDLVDNLPVNQSVII